MLKRDKCKLTGKDSLAQDFADVVYRFKLLGFNAVRIPFSFNYIWRLAPDQAGGAQKQACVRLSPDEVRPTHSECTPSLSHQWLGTVFGMSHVSSVLP